MEQQTPNYTYGKHEKLKSRKTIGAVFMEGRVLKAYPLRVHFITHTHDAESKIQCGFSVSKRNFKKAVDRNRVKRLMREAYRLHNHKLKGLDVGKNVAMMIVYSSPKLPEYNFIASKMVRLLDKIEVELKSLVENK